MTEVNGMVGWHHRLNGHESEQTPGDGEGQKSLACYSPWGCKESDTTKHSTTTNICDSEYIKKELYHNIMWLLEKKCIQGNA